MRTLSASLLAAQRSASAEPFVRVQLYDRDIGAPRLRWTRWYQGSEPDGPCAAAATADGALLRARIDAATGALSHQRVPAPGATSDYATWNSAGTVASGPRLGLAANGTRALLATVQADDLTIEVRESTDSGGSFGASSTVATAGSAATAVGCALQADGSAVVLYAVAGVVYRVSRSGGGAWSSPVAWTRSLSAVSGLAAYFEGDYNVVVSGQDAAGDAGVWATILGVGNGAPPNAWLALAAITLASAGTSVEYLVTGAATAAAPRALFVESFSGGGAYDRTQLASGAGSATFAKFLWREARPLDHTSAHGLALAAGPSDAWLCAPDGVWHASTIATLTELTADVTAVDLRQGLEHGRVRITLRNDDGCYNAGSAPLALDAGGELTIEPGFVTVNGAESSGGPRFWITAVRRTREDGGRATVEVEAVDGWGMLEAWTAPRHLVWAAGSQNAFQVLSGVVQRVGLQLVSTGSSTEAGQLQPAFSIRAGERGATAVRRLLEMLPDHVVMRGTSPTLTEPSATDPADYAFDADAAGDHAVYALRIRDGRPAAGWARVFGDGVFAEAVDEAVLREGGATALAVDDNLAVQARADARAATLLRSAALSVDRGELVTPVNAGQEPGDVITVTDGTLGLSAQPFRVAALRLRYERGGPRPRYDLTLSLTDV